MTHASVFDYPAFQPAKLIGMLLLALVLFGSWLYVPATRALWDALDLGIFRTLNGSLEHARWWQVVWAVGNNHFFDFLSSLLMTWLAYRYVMAGGEAYINERVCTILYIALVIVCTVVTVDKLLIEPNEKRASPTMVLENVFMLSEHVTWLTTKDASPNSYPSDHATVLTMVTLMLWHFAGKRTGLVMLAALFIFSFPRLIGGAHWFTDMAAGGLPLSLAAVAVAIYTPIYRYVIGGMVKVANLPLCHTGIRVGMHDEAASILAKGCCMGAADVVPGVSGGTMAYILGIWPRLMDAIKSFDLPWVKLVLTGKWTQALKDAHLAFLVPLFIGIVIAFVTFTKFIPLPKLIISHPEPIYGLFFGLIAGSILLLLQEMGKQSAKDMALIVVGAAAGWLLVNLVPVQTPESWWFIYLCGCIAISAMLLPGISGSFILLILGKYAYVLGAIGSFDFTVILPFVLGCATGVIIFSRAASWLLHHFYRQSVLVITGILIGSLWMIWPFQNRVYEVVREKERLVSSTPIWPESLTSMGQLGLVMMVVGVALVVALGVIAKRHSAAREAEIAERGQIG